MDDKGNHEKLYGEGSSSISFCYTYKITSTMDGHNFVIDQINDYFEGRVVVLGHEDTINTFCGSPTINTEDTLVTPTDLTTTPADNVIVVDFINCVLHILNSSGQLITYICTKDIVIAQYSFSLGLTMPVSIYMRVGGRNNRGHKCMVIVGGRNNRGHKCMVIVGGRNNRGHKCMMIVGGRNNRGHKCVVIVGGRNNRGHKCMMIVGGRNNRGHKCVVIVGGRNNRGHKCMMIVGGRNNRGHMHGDRNRPRWEP
ncbi:Hypothetical predicted protein [Mytilus galloprovincialis]|uniref:Uncharacterized protein n=1 Tax=Mytilus galloprovincialis TaxID=29158 RepID=A0A8B6CQL6_MYTGA|nr:Hypothetical predicted protein [Mytilus galloprovincialis]